MPHSSDHSLPRTPEPELMDLLHEAEAYAEANFAAVNDAYVDTLLELARDCESLRLVDLGTGPGDIPIRIINRRPKWHVTAVDAAPAMLKIAEKAIASHGMESQITPVLADGKSTTLPDDSFDAVISNSILHHVSDPAAFWSEVQRLAAPGAMLFHRDLMRPATASAAQAIVDEHAGNESEVLREEFYRSLLAAYTPDEVRQQLRAAGLSGITVEPITDRHLDIYGRIAKE